MRHNYLVLQNYLMAVGMLFASYNFVIVTMRYFDAGGTLLMWRIPGGLVNPLLVPCFYGMLAFLIGFVWTLTLRIDFSKVSQSRLIWLLVAGTIFAWGNYGYTLGTLYTKKVCNLGCLAGYFGIPQFTSCLVGATIFSLALIVAVRLHRLK